MNHTDLAAMRPCSEGLAFAAKHKTIQDAWAACGHGDWMLWLLHRISGPINTPSHRTLTKAKCVCARLVLHHFEDRYPDDKRPRKALESAEAYAGGDDYADAAAYASNADAADAAAYAAADAAANAAAYAANAAARVKMLARCANAIRKVVPNLDAFPNDQARQRNRTPHCGVHIERKNTMKGPERDEYCPHCGRRH